MYMTIFMLQPTGKKKIQKAAQNVNLLSFTAIVMLSVWFHNYKKIIYTKEVLKAVCIRSYVLPNII